MCWNEQVSFLTFIIVVIIVIRILQTNPSNTVRWQCYFVLAFISIQFLEGILWVSIKRRNNRLNAIITALVLIALWCQPLINCYFGAMLGSMTPIQKKILLILSVFFGVIVIYMIYRVLRGKESFQTETTNACHLRWTSKAVGSKSSYPSTLNPTKPSFMSDIKLVPILYLIGMGLPLLFMKNKTKENRRNKMLLLAVGIITLMVAIYFNKKDGSMGSMWCILAAFYVLAVLYIHYRDKKEVKASETIGETEKNHCMLTTDS